MIPWAYFLPSHKMIRRRFMIKMVPEMEATIHQDALRGFGRVVLRLATAPIWVPLAFGYIGLYVLAKGLEKVSDLCYNGIALIAPAWSSTITTMTDKEDAEEISKEEFWKRVKAHRDNGGHVPSYFLNYMKGRKL